jgi:3-oxoacyl-[acyl-carrier-protein] synthase II
MKLRWWNVSRCTHITTPHPKDAKCNAKLPKRRWFTNQLTLTDVNMHGTSTPLGDMAESKAILHVLVNMLIPWISIQQSMTGHLLGAAGCRNYFFHSFDEIRNCSPTINHVTNDETLILIEFHVQQSSKKRDECCYE